MFKGGKTISSREDFRTQIFNGDFLATRLKQCITCLDKKLSVLVKIGGLELGTGEENGEQETKRLTHGQARGVSQEEILGWNVLGFYFSQVLVVIGLSVVNTQKLGE